MAAFARNSGFRLLAACLALLFLLEPVTLSVAQAASSDATAPAEVILPGPLPPAPQELTEKRTAYSREFALPDGSRKVEVFLDPINYQDEAGRFQAIDPTVSASQKPGFAYENTRNGFSAFFPAQVDAASAVRVEKDGRSLEMRPLFVGAAPAATSPLPVAQVLKNTVTYPDTVSGASLAYQVLPGALKETILLKDVSAPTSFEFHLDIGGLRPQEASNGSIALLDEAGTPALLLPRPWAKDSAPGAEAVDLTQTIRPDGSGYILSVTLDPAWLTDPARVFPVAIDPTVEIQPATLDSFVSSANSNTSYSTQGSLLVGQDAAGHGYGETQSLLNFTPPALSSKPEIHQAYISLYKDKAEDTGTNAIQTYRITSSWTGSVTYNTRPSTTPTPDSTTPSEGPLDWYTFDVTSSMTLYYAGLAPDYNGFLLKAAAADPAGNLRQYRSSERSDPTSSRPKLTIVYTPAEPRHTTYDLGEFAGHATVAVLDQARLDVATTDLAIASFGPRAAIERRYSSARTSYGKFAYGWRFSFQRKLSSPSPDEIDYVDEAGEVHAFWLSGGVWKAPSGLVATLANPAPNWTLTFKDRTVLTFDINGTLINEVDRNGNAVAYYWSTNALTIRAANLQAIQVAFDPVSSEITSASYTAGGTTRRVTYTTAAPWKVTYLSGAGALQHSATYTYTTTNNKSRLTEIKATAFSGAAGDAKETFIYTNGALTEVRYPDYVSSIPNYNASNADARVTLAYNGSSATATSRGSVRTASAATGATGTAVTQVFAWNPSGTIASRTNPKVSGADETWSYTYEFGTNLLLAEISPLGNTRQWTYDSRGNVLSEKDELNNQTTYTYPASDTDPNRDLPLTVTDPRGAVTSYTYDTRGNPTGIVQDLNPDPPLQTAKTR